MEAATRGSAALDAGKNEEAVKHYDDAIRAHPTAPSYYIERSKAQQRCKNYESALADAEAAVVHATQRAKRELIVEAQKRRFIALFHLERYAEADYVFKIVKKMASQDKTLTIWEKKISDRYNALTDEQKKVEVKTVPDVNQHLTTSSNTGPADLGAQAEVAKTVQTPSKDIRHEWYENNNNVFFTLLAKGVPKDKAEIEILENSLMISYPLQDGYEYNFTLQPLFGPVDPGQSKYNITNHKIEVTLKKTQPTKWKSLERPASAADVQTASVDSVTVHNPHMAEAPNKPKGPSYPTSSKSGPKDWDKVVKESTRHEKKNEDGTVKEQYDDLDQEDGGDDVNFFFKKLYAGADEDTKRAMMKSYSESNGTALSTNWSEVSKAPVETSPPDGMEAKKWGT